MTALKSGYVLPNALLIPYSSPNFYPWNISVLTSFCKVNKPSNKEIQVH
jgi:hypothetical protein